MNFAEAFLKISTCIRDKQAYRPHWAGRASIVSVFDGYKEVIFINADGRMMQWLPSFEDAIADDWEIV